MELPDRIARRARGLAAIPFIPDTVNPPVVRSAPFGGCNAEAHAMGVREFTLES
jgi:hypothetical protein